MDAYFLGPTHKITPYNFIFNAKTHFATPLRLEFEMSQKHLGWFLNLTTSVPFIFKDYLTKTDDK